MKKTFKLSLAATLVASAMGANAAIYTGDNEKGSFYIDGNVELDTNYQSRESAENRDSWDQSGRVLIEFGGEQKTDAGYKVSFKAETLVDIDGNMNIDDAWLAIGHNNGAEFKIGRFEAYDMFPAGQDIFLEYTGDTSNDLIVDGSAYQYQMKEGRGRGESGQIMYNHSFDNLYLELATRIGDSSGLYANGSYHGQMIEVNKDSLIVRPVVAYQLADFRFSIAMETNVIKNAVTIGDADLSSAIGYGFSTNYNANGFDANFNVAYKDGVDETNKSVGLNATFMNFGLGYNYGENDYENKEIGGYAEGTVKVNTANASYNFEGVIVDNLNIALGAYYTTLDAELVSSDFNEEDDMGVRVRFFYDF